MRRNSFALPSSGRSSNFRGSRFGGNTRTQRPRNQGQYIDPRRFVNKAVLVQDEVIFAPVHTFADFNFAPRLAENIARHGYVHPTAIQDQAIKPAMEGRDVIGLANTGTGKTAAFVLPILHQLLTNPNQGQALIVAPTRELAQQIDEEFRAFAAGLRLYSVICVGGANMHRQIMGLRRNPHVVIGTPGRLKDLLNQRELKLHTTTMFVLDEADRMLDMGFIKDIRYLIDQLPAKRQSLCFSATITPDIQPLVDQLLKDPVTVSVRTAETSEHVEQDVLHANTKEEKTKILQDLLTQSNFDKVLVFGQTKWGVQKLAETLQSNGIKAEAIHGNKSQGQRQRALDAFKGGKVQVLVATDVAARGLDIAGVSHVVNFDQPSTYDDYVHRIGRTGRAGKRGHALTFIPGRAS